MICNSIISETKIKKFNRTTKFVEKYRSCNTAAFENSKNKLQSPTSYTFYQDSWKWYDVIHSAFLFFFQILATFLVEIFLDWLVLGFLFDQSSNYLLYFLSWTGLSLHNYTHTHTHTRESVHVAPASSFANTRGPTKWLFFSPTALFKLISFRRWSISC